MNKFKYKTLYTTIVLLTVLGSYGCKDFLNEPPQGSLDEPTLANQTGIEGNLTSAYAVLDGYDSNISPLWTSATSNWVLGDVVTDNSHKGSESGDQQGLQDLELIQWTLNTADQQLNDKWEMLYAGVNRANNTLNILEANKEDVSQADAERIRGEALALRAFYHFEAYKVWENVPVVTEDLEALDVPNTVPVLPQVLEDLNTAIELLPPNQDQAGRITKWDTKAMKGRVLIFQQQFNEAATILRGVVNNGPYQLVNSFWQVFSAFNDNHAETIWAFQASVNDGDPGGNNGNRQERLNFPHAGSPFGCCGFFQPSQNLVNAFQVNEEGLPLPVAKPDNWNTLEDNPDPDVPVDPRLDWTVGRDGVPFLDWGIHARAWIRSPTFAGIYSNKKNIWEQASNAKSNVGWATFQLHWKNMHILRFADVMLMLAEAEVELGNLEAARQLVNQIRVRAAAMAQGPTDDIEVPLEDNGDGTFGLQTDWATYRIGLYKGPWTDQAFARRAVRVERRLELAQEGHRLFDLRRWDMDQEVINNYLEIEEDRRPFLGGASRMQERNDRFPIPSEQLDLTSELQQNPGY